MPERANITSVEALEAFRANLIVYQSKARPALEEVSSDMMRMRLWIQDDRTDYWQGQYKRRRRVLEQAQQALFSARMSTLNEATSSAEFDFHRAKRALDEVADKLRKVKSWDKKFEGLVNPWLRQMEKLHTVLSHDVPLAIAHLSEMINLLTDYADQHASSAGAPAPAPLPSPLSPETSLDAPASPSNESPS